MSITDARARMIERQWKQTNKRHDHNPTPGREQMILQLQEVLLRRYGRRVVWQSRPKKAAQAKA